MATERQYRAGSGMTLITEYVPQLNHPINLPLQLCRVGKCSNDYLQQKRYVPGYEALCFWYPVAEWSMGLLSQRLCSMP